MLQQLAQRQFTVLPISEHYILWLQGKEVCCNEGGEERGALHRNSTG